MSFMRIKKHSILLHGALALSFLFPISCSQKPQQDPLLAALASQHPAIKRVMDSLPSHELQIRFTQIEHQGDSIVFVDHDFQVDSTRYFYPASSVKMPIAALTLEKLNSIDSLNRNTRFYVEGDSIETTFAAEINKIFAVSDNDAYNRLFEFLGQDAINLNLREKGIQGVRIAHRLSTDNADDITTKPLVIYLNDSTTALSRPIINHPAKPLELEGTQKGKGFWAEDSLYRKPFDMSLKNYYSIPAQYNVLKRLIFPEVFPENQRFHISPEQRDFLLKEMSGYPRNMGYDGDTYYDSYGKFFLYGDSHDTIPPYIHIYNKVGYAYGTLTDCAYIKDSKNGVEFMLVATILVNRNQIFNDNTYEFDEEGIPFLAQLGRELYQYELNQNQ